MDPAAALDVMTTSPVSRLDISKPRWDQSTLAGRFQHFVDITDWRNGLRSEQELNDSKDLLDKYRLCQEPPGTTEEQIWQAKKLYESAFHPDSGEKQNVIGRMSFQVPGGMLITGCMMQFYRTVPQVVFFQWVNQSFNALVNYTNRNAKSETTNKQIGVAYVSATSAALVVSLGLNSLVKSAPPLFARYVPFVAVASANCVNIPLMRQREIANGIMVYDSEGNEIGMSQKAANKSIAQVCFSRVTMAAPGMLIIPLIMEKLERYSWMQRVRILHAPLQVLLCGVSLSFMTPFACSMFPQMSSLRFNQLEQDIQDDVTSRGVQIDKVFFNKGL